MLERTASGGFRCIECRASDAFRARVPHTFECAGSNVVEDATRPLIADSVESAPASDDDCDPDPVPV